MRVTASEGKIGGEYLKAFRDNEKTIPTILMTSQKLSTGVNARNVRYVVLMRGVGSMVEFKQIVGRGTHIYDGKDFFTIVDFNDNVKHFSDPEWDGEPLVDLEITDPDPIDDSPITTSSNEGTAEQHDKQSSESDGEASKKQKLEVRLPDGKIRKIAHTVETIYFGNDGKVMSPREFLEEIFGALPQYFTSEEDLKRMWANPSTRERLLDELANNGFDQEKLDTLRDIIDAEDSDMYDVLRYVAFAKDALSRGYRAEHINRSYFGELNEDEEGFIRFVLDKYTSSGEQELSEKNLSTLLEIKYHSLNDAVASLGAASHIKDRYVELQKELYEVEA